MAARGLCFFVSDLHGGIKRYETLFRAILEECPEMVFLGGDLLPSHGRFSGEWEGDFLREFLHPRFLSLQQELKEKYPSIFLILGNDDPRTEEPAVLEGEQLGLWTYLHNRRIEREGYSILGYAFVPPTPFRLKDWEKYDVSRYAEPGSIEPPEGWHSVPVSESEVKYSTIAGDLKSLAGDDDLQRAVFLFHAPPYNTQLDRAALDGKMIDHAPLDVHVGSIAIRRFIETRKPLLTLHGHIHESPRITGSWKDTIGKTWMFSAAHDGPELSLVRFRLDQLESATRELL
jgi:Icc-related predicted phosphoesterase